MQRYLLLSVMHDNCTVMNVIVTCLVPWAVHDMRVLHKIINIYVL